jgi:DNA-binding transcriptional ArsR family regulator
MIREDFVRIVLVSRVEFDMQLFGCTLWTSVDEVFKALADPSRRKLLDELHKKNGQTLGELCDHLDMTRQAASKHLALLEAANLAVTVRRGREKLHYLNPMPLHEIYERWIAKYERHRLQALSDLKKRLEADKRREPNGKTKIRLRHLH